MQLNNRLAVVSGASSGIGAAVSLALGQRGARVALLARNAAELDHVAQSIHQAGGEARPFAVDLADSDALESVAASVLRELGTPDVLINNAGAGRWLFVDETSPSEAMAMVAVPYLAAFGLTGAFLPGMLARGEGHVVNVTSIAAYFTWPGATAYTAARWAMRGFNEALRADLDGTRIGVTLFAASTVESEYWANNPGSRERLPRASRSTRPITPQEAARAIVSGIENGRREVILPRTMAFLVWLHRMFPGLVEMQLVRSGYHRPALTPKFTAYGPAD
jgi:short-subunit dehydrogenase